MNGKKLIWRLCSTWLVFVIALPYWGIVQYWDKESHARGQEGAFIWAICWVAVVVEAIVLTMACGFYVAEHWKDEETM